jgi:peptidoglycan hydrolase-like protein with peptidoglycan-binding domain
MPAWERSVRSVRILSRAARPPVLVGAGFFLLAAAIAANALFFQPKRHPAPLFSTRAPAQAEAPPAIAQPDALVEAIQSSLREAGFYAGAVDGVAGPQTAAAVSEWQRHAGQPVTGRADIETLTAIQSANAAAARSETVATRSSAAAGSPADVDVAAVQEALAKAAYGPLKADGVVGQQTRDAVMRFQRDHGLPATGEISDALVQELKAAGAL